MARTMVHHRNVYASEKEGFGHCNDCALEARIWQRYMEKYVAPANRDIRAIFLCTDTVIFFAIILIICERNLIFDVLI